MPRFYKRKEGAKPRTKIDPEKMKLAVVEAVKRESGILTTAKKYNVDRMTLKRYMKKYESNTDTEMTSNYKKRLIFTQEQEAELAEYLKICAKMNNGLTYRKVRELAYELAVENKIPTPLSWDTNKIAGSDWLKGYMKRNRSLSLRTPEATSLSRATSFNKNNVNDFFTNLKTILDREKISERDIWNIDETGYTTVQKPKKIIAPKGQKQVGQITSGERGQLVTVCCAISGSGRSIPPFMVFPRVNFKTMMLTGAPPDSAGTASPSGWMTSETFYLYLQHFTTHVQCSQERKVLVLLDNHESHISIKSLDFSKKNGIILLTLPPHCSHRLQPLDVSVFSSFKNACDLVAKEWMRNHPGRVITIYDISHIIGKAFPIAMTISNIINGFKKTGVCPYNPSIFKEEDFLPSYVTDRHCEINTESTQTSEPTSSETTNPVTLVEQDYEEPVAGPSGSSSSTNFLVSPEQLLPFPKAGSRKLSKKGRKKLKSAILTDTPIKNDIESELRLREEKKMKKTEKSKTRTTAQLMKTNKVEKVKRKVLKSSSSSSDMSEVPYAESDDSWNKDSEEFEHLAPVNNDTLKKGKFAIVQFKGGKRLTSIYKYLCLIDDVDDEDGECRVVSLKCLNDSKKIFSLLETDVSDVKFEQIIGITPDPTISLKGERIYYQFSKPLEIFEIP